MMTTRMMIGLILICSIALGLSFLIGEMITPESFSVKCNKNLCESHFPEQNYDFNRCVHIKTSIIHSIRDRFDHNYLIDSDGFTYDWDGGLSEYRDYEYHNVTFVYNSCDKVRGYNQFIGIMQDNSCCGV